MARTFWDRLMRRRQEEVIERETEPERGARKNVTSQASASKTFRPTSSSLSTSEASSSTASGTTILRVS